MAAEGRVAARMTAAAGIAFGLRRQPHQTPAPIVEPLRVEGTREHAAARSGAFDGAVETRQTARAG